MNNKGFLLVETLITTCIIGALATSIYIYINNTIKNYEKREYYDNIVDVYKTNNIRKYLYTNFETLNLNDTSTWSNGIKEITNNDFKNHLKAEKILLVKNDLNNVNKTNIINETNNKSFKEYIRLLSFTGESANYRLIVHYKENNNNSFSSLEVKKLSSS